MESILVSSFPGKLKPQMTLTLTKMKIYLLFQHCPLPPENLVKLIVAWGPEQVGGLQLQVMVKPSGVVVRARVWAQLAGAEAGVQEQPPRAQLPGAGAGAGAEAGGGEQMQPAGAEARVQLFGTVAGEKLAGAEAEGGEWVLELLCEKGGKAEGEREG